MQRKFLLFYFLLMLTYTFGQQNQDFKEVKDFYDYQKFMLNKEFKKRFDKEKNLENKIRIKDDFHEFMIKLDSVQNNAMIYTLVRVKVKEDLQKLEMRNARMSIARTPRKSEVSVRAYYPGGFDLMKRQLVDSFYSDAVHADNKILKTSLLFVVEKDGSISSVKADGDNFTFNRQAEIALYLLPEKFSPAYVKGEAVQYRFRLPLAMNFE